jgi:TonB-dependent SusC/RagA subfamily outer membrane receptor
MQHLIKVFFGLALATISVPTLAQQALPDQVQAYFTRYQEDFPVEKAYLHLDKFTYTLGEDLWFSAYLVAGGTQVPSPLSKTLYVDLFDGDGLLVAQKIVQLEQGRGAGDFKFPSFGKTGNYQLKAYTTWMKNAGADYYFSQQVRVVDGQGGSFLPKLDVLELRTEAGKVRYRMALEGVNASGEPLSNKEVTLKAIAGEEVLLTQSLQLNAQGMAEFGISIPDRPHSAQHLALSFEESKEYTVTQKVQLPYSLAAADIQFLPEGGQWIIGKKATVAFRAVYPDGTPVALTGSLEGEAETDFSSNVAGLGKIEFTPQKEEYVALIRSSSHGETRRIALPKAQASGLSIQVQQPENGAFISAFIQGNEVPGNLLFVAHTRGTISFMMQGKLSNGVWGVRVPKKNLPTGIHTLAVLDEQGRPLLERMVFVRSDDALTIDLSKGHEPMQSRGKVTLGLTSSAADSIPLTSLSVAVVDLDQVQDESETYGTLFSHLLLSSDLKGKIYRPGYYFKDNSLKVREELDLVLLTHGWSRFTWEDVMKGTFPDQGHYIEQGITIAGKITEQTPTKKGLGGGKISALVGEGIELLATEYGPDGSFLLTDLQYQDSVSVTLTAEDQRARNFINLAIAFPTLQFPDLEGSYPTEIYWPKELIATVQERNLMQQLTTGAEVTDLEAITVEANTLQEEQTQSRMLYGEGDASIKPDEIPGGQGFINIFQLIQGRVAGVRVTFDGVNATVLIRGVGSLQAGLEPMYMLNNVPVDASTLAQISPRDVESVEVFKDPSRTAIFGSQGGNGVIAVYTKTGANISYTSVGGTLVAKYSGYSTPRVFYSPKYEEGGSSTSLTDKRSTLYWNPLLKTGKDGKAEVTYYNSTSATKHLLIVEGIDQKGRLGRLVKIVQ